MGICLVSEKLIDNPQWTCVNRNHKLSTTGQHHRERKGYVRMWREFVICGYHGSRCMCCQGSVVVQVKSQRPTLAAAHIPPLWKKWNMSCKHKLTDRHSLIHAYREKLTITWQLFILQTATNICKWHTHTTRYKFLVSQDTPTVFVKQHVSWTEHTVMMQHCCRKHATEQQARQKTRATIQRRLHWNVHIFTPKPSPWRLAGLGQWNHSSYK